MCMRKLIVVAFIAAILVGCVIVVTIDVTPYVPSIRVVSVDVAPARVDVRLLALATQTLLRAPPA